MPFVKVFGGSAPSRGTECVCSHDQMPENRSCDSDRHWYVTRHLQNQHSDTQQCQMPRVRPNAHMGQEGCVGPGPPGKRRQPRQVTPLTRPERVAVNIATFVRCRAWGGLALPV